jgi:hypothetical protein
MKFQLIREFLVLNTSVLLSDVDILTHKNPFEHLYRDEDVEALSDGFDKQTAYGGWGGLSAATKTVCHLW